MMLAGVRLNVSVLELSFFFFSSRRRHTRLQGDWSSDVCSSDLEVQSEPGKGTIFEVFLPASETAAGTPGQQAAAKKLPGGSERILVVEDDEKRSEERRVGKECRSRWSPYH